MAFEQLRLTFQRWRERWTNWVGDREMELSIRKRLTAAGYYGNTAKLTRVQLVALERPGWVQVYRFEYSAKKVGQTEMATGEGWTNGFGVVSEDARKMKSEVRLFQTRSQWIDGLRTATKDLVTLKRIDG